MGRGFGAIQHAPTMLFLSLYGDYGGCIWLVGSQGPPGGKVSVYYVKNSFLYYVAVYYNEG